MEHGLRELWRLESTRSELHGYVSVFYVDMSWVFTLVGLFELEEKGKK